METYYPTYKSQTNILDKQVEETLLIWNVLYKRINECENSLNNAYTRFTESLGQSLDTIENAFKTRLL